uniref:Uncharacterized protein n=1 Tax=Lepeophtheirus salmonis TaxID=72036 RepID=A0A0K2UW85_LEPSM
MRPPTTPFLRILHKLQKLFLSGTFTQHLGVTHQIIEGCHNGEHWRRVVLSQSLTRWGGRSRRSNPFQSTHLHHFFDFTRPTLITNYPNNIQVSLQSSRDE